MKIEPSSLNVPLERKERWGLLLAVVCALMTLAAAFISPSFAIVFAASSVVGLPMVLLLFFPSSVASKFFGWGGIGRLAFFVLVFGYIGFAKAVLVPMVIGVMEWVMERALA